MVTEGIPSAVRQSAKALAEPIAMRRGSVSERFMKCGRKGCRCKHDSQARHGPYYSLTRVEDGKTRSRYLTAAQVPMARQQIEAGREFRANTEAYWQACEQWADAQLEGSEATSQEAAKKGASKRRSKPRSSPR